jgi:DNA-binding response OmpR family regulator
MTQEPYHLLVVDDEDTARASLADILRLEGYRVDTANGGELAIQKITKNNYDLILLDLKMPGVDGLDVLRTIASQADPQANMSSASQPPPTVIMLTAHGSLESAIEALRQGAHDYLLKPSSPEQILNSVQRGLSSRAAQIQQNLRLQELEKNRQHLEERGVESKRVPRPAFYHLPYGIVYDPARREMIYKDVTIMLTPTEGKLIKVLLDNPGHVFNHRELVRLVQGYDTKDWEAPEVLRPLISRLRHKLSRLPEGDHWITSVRGTGYVFEIKSVPQGS